METGRQASIEKSVDRWTLHAVKLNNSTSFSKWSSAIEQERKTGEEKLTGSKNSGRQIKKGVPYTAQSLSAERQKRNTRHCLQCISPEQELELTSRLHWESANRRLRLPQREVRRGNRVEFQGQEKRWKYMQRMFVTASHYAGRGLVSETLAWGLRHKVPKV